MVKCTFFFECGKYGWTETLYSSFIGLQAALEAAIELIPLRVSLLAGPSKMTAVRASDDDAALDSVFYAVPEADGTGSAWGNSSDVPFTCFDFRMEAAPLHRRAYQLRGIPDDFVVDGGQMAISPAYRGRVTVFKNRLIGGSWGMRVRGPAAAAVNISNMVNENGHLSVTITTAVAHGFAQNDLVYISGRSNVKGFNGTWKIGWINATQFQILSSRPTGVLFFGLKVRKLTYTFSAFTNLIVMRVSHRITGRPFDAPVGKRKGRSLR